MNPGPTLSSELCTSGRPSGPSLHFPDRPGCRIERVHTDVALQHAPCPCESETGMLAEAAAGGSAPSTAAAGFPMKASFFVLVVSMIARAAAPVTTLANFPNSMAYAVQTDAAGNISVAGFQGNFAKSVPLVAKLSPTGQTLYSTTLAGSNFGIAWAIAVDSSGAAYVFGNTNSPDFPVTPGALQTTTQGTSQGFVAKLDPTGKIVYSTFIGGAANVTPGLTSAPGLDSILVDSAGDVIITGQAGTNSILPPFPPAPAESTRML